MGNQRQIRSPKPNSTLTTFVGIIYLAALIENSRNMLFIHVHYLTLFVAAVDGSGRIRPIIFQNVGLPLG